MSRVSNFYPTPFILDDECYGSVEGFWQSLKCEAPALRRQVASLSGTEAKKAAGKGPPSETFDYIGETIRTGTHAHWALMERAWTAKFTQVVFAREALLATGNRPLTQKCAAIAVLSQAYRRCCSEALGVIVTHR